MLFNSIHFFFFFPIITILYYILPQKLRWGMLLAASCYFYMAFVPFYILILVVTILIDYFAAIFIENSPRQKKKKYLLIVSIISTCLVLFIFKYYNFFTSNLNYLANALHWNYSIETLKILLPIGLSFHTFQSLSYVIEVYYGRQKAERHFGIYSLYVMYYPQLVAGPIERPQNLLYQFREHHKFNSHNVISGLKLMLWGYFLKLVVADRAAIYVDIVYNNVDQHDGLTFMAATVLFAFQIYGDFAGYSLIAIGASRTMGIKLMQNFNRPYFAASIHEFWKRWHISLSTWFRDYLYIPLGGNRVSKNKWLFNLFITFTVSGLWHGANWTFVIWGILHSAYLIIDILLDRKGKRSILNVFLTFCLVCFAWIFFRANSLADSFTIVKDIFLNPGRLFIPQNEDIIVPIYALLAILILLITEFKKENLDNVFTISESKYEWVRLSYYSLVLFVILFIGVFDGGQFIYFQF